MRALSEIDGNFPCAASDGRRCRRCGRMCGFGSTSGWMREERKGKTRDESGEDAAEVAVIRKERLRWWGVE